ncbi:hypothetical protein PCCS19_42150 [Paenibacillus sp. CCS19]|uniref:glycosyltransferase family 4 protein n=1 Tax=Paenibacillus sp. CCS19 TaxID=3158387 RepID=UPI00255F8774|nr:glycosyltransferase family 4 protein [Paenibacillus cellulosilyticus]GMK41159.1 hypothetical protein PCCS19_42150 [Paenibacillus cellulosilyticus]
MNQICLMDNILDGHHTAYLKTLNQIPATNNISKEMMTISPIRSIVPYMKERFAVFRYAFGEVNHRFSVLHFLYIDNLYVAGAAYRFPKHCKLIGTLHQFPQSSIKQKLLRMFCRRLEYVIVHSEFTGAQLEEIGIFNYVVINYPVFYNSGLQISRNEMKVNAGLSEDKMVISALGGTRSDKGLDLLLQALKYIGKEYHDKLIINIAGKEENITKEQINHTLSSLDIESRVVLRLLSDEEFYQNVKLSDAIILPYRTIFNGNSGPMTEGVYQGIPIIGPSHGNIGALINRHRLGYTFESENIESIARTIEHFINDKWQVNELSEQYRQSLEVGAFIQNHQELYEKLIN